MGRADANGSFLVKSTGAVEYMGTGGGDNQLVTFNPENNSFENTNLEDLFGGACVSQYTQQPPTTRPKPQEAELEIGDFWTRKSDRILHIWDGTSWVQVYTANGNPIGTIITTVNTVQFTPPPPGYLACDGTPCPPEYEELRAILFAATGSFVLPNRGFGVYIKF